MTRTLEECGKADRQVFSFEAPAMEHGIIPAMLKKHLVPPPSQPSIPHSASPAHNMNLRLNIISALSLVLFITGAVAAPVRCY